MRKRRKNRMRDKLAMADTLNLFREDFHCKKHRLSDLNRLLIAKDDQESPVSYPNSRIKEISDIETEDISELLESQEGEVNRKLESIKAKYTQPSAVIEEEPVESGGSSVFVNSHRNYELAEIEHIEDPRGVFSSFETKNFSSAFMNKKPKNLKKLEHISSKDRSRSKHRQKKVLQERDERVNNVKNSFKRVLKEKTNFEQDCFFFKEGYMSDKSFCKTFDHGTRRTALDTSGGQSTLRRLNLRRNPTDRENDKENQRVSDFTFKKNSNRKKKNRKDSVLGSKFNRSYKHLRRKSYDINKIYKRNNSFSQRKKKVNISNDLINKKKSLKKKKMKKSSTSNFLMKLKRKLSKTSEEYIKKNKLMGVNSDKALKFSKYLEMSKRKNMLIRNTRDSYSRGESEKDQKIRVMEETIKNQNLFIKSLISKIDNMKNFEEVLIENQKLKSENRNLKIDMLKSRNNKFLKKCNNCR